MHLFERKFAEKEHATPTRIPFTTGFSPFTTVRVFAPPSVIAIDYLDIIKE